VRLFRQGLHLSAAAPAGTHLLKHEASAAPPAGCLVPPLGQPAHKEWVGASRQRALPAQANRRRHEPQGGSSGASNPWDWDAASAGVTTGTPGWGAGPLRSRGPSGAQTRVLPQTAPALLLKGWSRGRSPFPFTTLSPPTHPVNPLDAPHPGYGALTRPFLSPQIRERGRLRAGSKEEDSATCDWEGCWPGLVNLNLAAPRSLRLSDSASPLQR
jgi:hypothetical protein